MRGAAGVAGRGRIGLEEINFTADEQKAMRVVTLAVFLTNAAAPVATSDLNERFYAELSDENRKKTFRRDRELLKSLGFGIVAAGTRALPGGGSEHLWRADEESNFASGAELEPLDAIALNAACQSLFDDPGFMPTAALRSALSKIDRTFGDAGQAIQANAPQVDETRATIFSCIEEGVAARVSYRKDNGEKTERVFAPLYTFAKYRHGYVVGDMVEEGCARRTLRIDRIEDIKKLQVKYDVPTDFDINDYPQLPFQMGNARGEATFLVPSEREADLRREAGGKGTFAQDNGRTTWRITFADENDAACWAVARGLRALSPKTVVDAWTRCLKGVVSDGC